MKDPTQLAAEAAAQLFPNTKKRNHRSKAQIRAQAIIQTAIEKAVMESRDDKLVELSEQLYRAAHARDKVYVRCSKKDKDAMKLMGFDVWVKPAHASEPDYKPLERRYETKPRKPTATNRSQRNPNAKGNRNVSGQI